MASATGAFVAANDVDKRPSKAMENLQPCGAGRARAAMRGRRASQCGKDWGAGRSWVTGAVRSPETNLTFSGARANGGPRDGRTCPGAPSTNLVDDCAGRRFDRGRSKGKLPVRTRIIPWNWGEVSARRSRRHTPPAENRQRTG